MLSLEQLESRDTPATLTLSGGVLTFADAAAENNNLTVGVAAGVYSLNDSANLIYLDDGAKAVGWKGSGTHSVSGPELSVDSITISLGGGTNVVNVRSLKEPLTVNGESGSTTVNLNSVAPAMIGNLVGIQADVTVVAGDATSLNASDYTGTTRANPVAISSSGITGLGSHAINITGTLVNLMVSGSNAASLAESYTVDSPSCSNFTLKTNGGADDVTVTGWGSATATFDGGSGAADSLTILDGVAVSGIALNFETQNYNIPGYGTLS